MPQAIFLTLTIILSVALLTLFFLLIRHLILRHPTNTTTTTTTIISVPTPAVSVSTRSDDHSFNDFDSLPLFNYASVSNLNSTNSSDCAVCLAEFEPQDALRLLPICCHAFHSSCIDTWLLSNRTCPLCRCEIFVSEEKILNKVLAASLESAAGRSFRVEIGSVSSRRMSVAEGGESRIGSFRYVVVEGGNGTVSERENNNVNAPGGDVSRRSWLWERVSSAISSRTVSFRGSSRRELFWDVEANRAGEEITETFRWLSGV